MTDGDYYRLLHDGDYQVTVTAEGYHPTTKCVSVQNLMYLNAKEHHQAQEVDFTLTPATEEQVLDKEAEALCEGIVRQVEEKIAAAENDVEVRRMCCICLFVYVCIFV